MNQMKPNLTAEYNHVTELGLGYGWVILDVITQPYTEYNISLSFII